MEGIATVFICIGCLLLTLFVSFIVGGIFSMPIGLDPYMLAWIVSSGLFAIILTIVIIKEIF